MDQISLHEVRVYQFLRDHPETWFSNSDIAKEVPEVALRTIRAHTKRFFEVGLVEKVQVFPGDHFRFVDSAETKDYIERLEEARTVLSRNGNSGHSQNVNSLKKR